MSRKKNLFFIELTKKELEELLNITINSTPDLTVELNRLNEAYQDLRAIEDSIVDGLITTTSEINTLARLVHLKIQAVKSIIRIKMFKVR